MTTNSPSPFARIPSSDPLFKFPVPDKNDVGFFTSPQCSLEVMPTYASDYSFKDCCSRGFSRLLTLSDGRSLTALGSLDLSWLQDVSAFAPPKQPHHNAAQLQETPSQQQRELQAALQAFVDNEITMPSLPAPHSQQSLPFFSADCDLPPVIQLPHSATSLANSDGCGGVDSSIDMRDILADSVASWAEPQTENSVVNLVLPLQPPPAVVASPTLPIPAVSPAGQLQQASWAASVSAAAGIDVGGGAFMEPPFFMHHPQQQGCFLEMTPPSPFSASTTTTTTYATLQRSSHSNASAMAVWAQERALMQALNSHDVDTAVEAMSGVLMGTAGGYGSGAVMPNTVRIVHSKGSSVVPTLRVSHGEFKALP